MNPSNFHQLSRRNPSPARGYGTVDTSSANCGRGRSSSGDFDDTTSSRTRPCNSELNNMANIDRVVGSIQHSADNHVHNHVENEENDQNVETPLLQRVASFYTPSMEDKLRRKLKFFFMDPCDKFRAKRKWPWKLTLQILKILIVTIQLVIFGQQRSTIVKYFESNHIALQHLLLKNWDPSYETLPYPPATGQYALYTRQQLVDYIDFAMERYNHTPKVAVGTFHLERVNETVVPIIMCMKGYKTETIFINGSFVVDRSTGYDCLYIEPVQEWNNTSKKTETVYDILKFLKTRNKSLDLNRLLELDLRFTYYSYHLGLFAAQRGPSCFKLNITIVFDNTLRDGQVLIKLRTDVSERKCHGTILSSGDEVDKIKLISYDMFVVIICSFSFLLCLRSIYRAQKLRKETAIFFNNRFGKKLDCSDQMEFLNLWYLLIVCNDTLTITGSAFKIQLEDERFSSSSRNYDIGSLMLGVGGLMAWTGVLRYLGFFKKYNILILTLKRAFPNVLRFLVCAMVLYFGFMFCGWLVLGPYHIKFRTISSTSECLFSLVNGDDMFVTFSATLTNSDLVWYFSRVYLYTFISLFIYIVLSLFIAVIMDTYETLKYHYQHGYPKSDLWEFISQCEDPPHSALYREDQKGCSFLSCLGCCKSDDPDMIDERTSLLNKSI